MHCYLIIFYLYILLTTRFVGPYYKLRTAVFPLGYCGLSAQRKKRGFVTYRVDRENEVIEIFQMSLGSSRGGSF